MNLSENLKYLREEQGISQMKLSIATGLSHSAIARWELGQSEPTASSLIILAEFFGVSVDEILGLTSDLLLNTPVTKTEIQELYDNLVPEQQKALLNYARGMAVSNQLDNSSAKKKRA